MAKKYLGIQRLRNKDLMLVIPSQHFRRWRLIINAALEELETVPFPSHLDKKAIEDLREIKAELNR